MIGRFTLPVISTALALLAVPATASASHVPGGAPAGEDFAVGSASTKQSSLDCCLVNLDAHSGPTGESPTGTASMTERSFFVGGPVTCLRVTGNRAIIGGTFGGPGGGYLFEVEDNSASGQPDRFSSPPAFAPVPGATCPTDLDTPLRDVTSGDLIVHDATPPPPVPSHLRQCLGGGWKAFGFPSLQRCLTFVILARVCEILERHGSHPGFCPPRPPRP
jgi:hypothetical protein